MSEDRNSDIEALLRLFEEHKLLELVVEEGSFKVHLRSDRLDPAPPARAPRRRLRRPRAPTAERPRTLAVRSPLVGVFYRAPTPDAPNFVDIGDMVEEGQTIGIVEAMKVFNEIKAEWGGRVVAIPAENGTLVQAGEPLVVLEFTLEGEGGREGA